jgi:hypothetical protein
MNATRTLLIGAFLLIGRCTASANVIVGGFDTLRSQEMSFSEGASFEMARASMIEHFGPMTFLSSPELDNAFLDNVDILIVSCAQSEVNAIAPLTSAEQAALGAFITRGGSVFGILENRDFNNTQIEAVFGMHIAGVIPGYTEATITDPASPVANGPFGTVTRITQGWPGHFDVIAVGSCEVARNNIGVCLVVIPPDGMSEGSGPAVLHSDSQTFVDDAEWVWANFSGNEVLFLNIIQYLIAESPILRERSSWGSVKAGYR